MKIQGHGRISTPMYTQWKTLSKNTIVELAAEGTISVDRLREYINTGLVTRNQVLQEIDWGMPQHAQKVLKKYYAVLFLEG